MTYATDEASIEDGSPVFLYEFVQEGAAWRYCSDIDPITYAGHVWLSANVSHSEISMTGEVARDALTLTFPVTHEFAGQFVGYPPEYLTSFTLYRGHRGGAEFRVLWKGRVLRGEYKGASVELECESVFTSLQRPGLRALYQRPCRHAVYKGGCRLSFNDWDTPVDVVTVSGVSVSVTGITEPDGYFTGGMIQAATGELRMIVYHAGGLLTLARPMPSLAAGDAVKIFPGCDRQAATCSAKFSNIINCGGFRWIPQKNPFGGASVL